MDRRRDFNSSGGRDRDNYGGGRRDYNGGGGYRSSRSGSSDSGNSANSNYSYSSREGGGGYRGGRGRGGGRGGGFGAPGGRSGADDSTTTKLPSREPELFSIPELGQLPPIPPRKEMIVRTNGYEIDTKNAKVAFQYDIRWTGENKKGKTFDMNSQTKDDVKLQHKQTALFSVFYTLIHSNKEFFGTIQGDEQFSYDCGSMFFTQTKLLKDDEHRTFDIEIDDFKQEAKDYYRQIVKASAEISFTREIRPDLLNGELENDRPAIQYLELVFSQAQRLSGNYLSFGNKFYEKKSSEEIDRTPLILKEGVTRSIRIIGDPADKKLMVQMVPTKTTFYDSRSVKSLIEHAIGGARLEDIFRGNKLKLGSNAIKNLCLRTTHLERNRNFIAYGLTSESAERITFELDGKKLSVADYFLQKYNIRLRYPQYPCVIQKRGKEDKNYFPIEVLRIPENQRVPKAKQGNDLNALIIRKCQMLPADNVEKIEKNREDAEILNSNGFIKNTGARVEPRQLVTAPARQLLTPSIVFKDTQKTLNCGVFGMQTNDKFVQPAAVRKLACVLASNQIDSRRAEDFVNNFLRRLELYGVRIDKHDLFDWSNPDRDSERLLDIVKQDYDFAFIIGDTDQLHHGMKHMELSTKMPTQHVRTRTVLKANNTLFDNLAFKFNLKAGGVNWALTSDPGLVTQLQNRDLLKSLMQNTLFFGIDLSHPLARADPNLKVENVDPSCVGFASNIFKGHANMAKGDFGYQDPQQHIVNAELLEAKFTAAINAYFRNSGQYPSWIVVYRAGLSEAEIQKIQSEEVPVLKSAIEKMKAQSAEFNSSAVRLTVIMSNEMSNFRLFKDQIDKRDKAPMQNVPSGTCVSERIVSRRVPSFLLVAQRALIGTARPAVFHILEGADAVPLEHVRYVTYCLCFSHGIVASPTKLPGPLVSAADLSKRARNNFRQHKYQGIEDTQSVGSGDAARYRQGQGDILTEDEKQAIRSRENAYFDDLNQALKAAIEDGRFWA
uniref:Piwi domain-containing protein n=1 Tax=Panagrolaimus superbus TaxID=310955 RepID=A0A914Y6P7_9BILA